MIPYQHEMSPPTLIDLIDRTAPSMIRVEGDPFDGLLADDELDLLFATFALHPHHTFQVVAHWAEVMEKYLASACGRIADRIIAIRRQRGDTRAAVPLPNVSPGAPWWPLQNVWVGAAVGDQNRAEKRVPHLMHCPAAVRFLSCEPLLGPVDLEPFISGDVYGHWCCGAEMCECQSCRIAHAWPWDDEGLDHLRPDWIIVGGDTGRYAQPCDIAWVRSIIDQGAGAGVPVFVKQLGSRPIFTKGDPPVVTYPGGVKKQAPPPPCGQIPAGRYALPGIRDPKGADPHEWPDDEIRVREFPTVVAGGVA